MKKTTLFAVLAVLMMGASVHAMGMKGHHSLKLEGVQNYYFYFGGNCKGCPDVKGFLE